jgi:hypothetical protein
VTTSTRPGRSLSSDAGSGLARGMSSGDYQETDCIHLGRGGPNGALHDSGSVSGWSVDTTSGTLTMYGVNIIGKKLWCQVLH